MATPKLGTASTASLADYTGPSLIIPQLAAADAAGVVRELSPSVLTGRHIGNRSTASPSSPFENSPGQGTGPAGHGDSVRPL